MDRLRDSSLCIRAFSASLLTVAIIPRNFYALIMQKHEKEKKENDTMSASVKKHVQELVDD